ncbi:alpha/beta hydrolase [Rhodopila sp.]|uniref:alpha/beta hydrolase n=1 Tax=Rhodopila sp. TaxID=2480087 RepID=UPI003D0F27CA
MPRVAVQLVALMLLSACSPALLLNLTAPRAGVTWSSDIAYAPGPDHTLDIYAPSHRCANAPVVVFFYGGGWESGSRSSYRFVGASLAARGVVTVIPDYRLYPTVRFPAFMQDAAEAVAWTRAHVEEYGGDPNRLFLMGHSAGGQIATLLALDGSYLRADGVDPRQIRGVIGLAGPYDFLPLRSRTLKAIFGPETEWPRSQPINYVTSGAPPMMLAAGTADDTVDPGNTTRLAVRLRQDGVAVDEHLYPGLGHKLLIGAFASGLTSFAPVRRDTLRFIAAHGDAGAGCGEATR